MAASWATEAVRTDEYLITAATRGDLARVKDYLDHGAVSSARNHHLLTALHWAVTMGHTEVAEVCCALISIEPSHPAVARPRPLTCVRSSWSSVAPM